MRRLWAHVLIAFTCIVAVFAAFPSLAKEIKSGGDYSTRRQFTFQLKEKKQARGWEKAFLTGCGMSAFAHVSLDGLPVVSCWCP